MVVLFVQEYFSDVLLQGAYGLIFGRRHHHQTVLVSLILAEFVPDRIPLRMTDSIHIIGNIINIIIILLLGPLLALLESNTVVIQCQGSNPRPYACKEVVCH